MLNFFNILKNARNITLFITGKHEVHHGVLLYVRGGKVLSEFVFDFSCRVDGKNSREVDTHSSVGVCVIGPVSVTSKEGVRTEQSVDVLKTSDLELLRVPINDLPLEGVNEGVGVEEDRTVRKGDVTLLDTLEVILGDRGLADGPGAEVHDPVAVLLDLAVQVRHAGVGPVLACGECKVKIPLKLKLYQMSQLPMTGSMCPSTSDLVMVPSISEMTSLSV